MKVVAKLVQLRCKNSIFFWDLQIFDEKRLRWLTQRAVGSRGRHRGKENGALRLVRHLMVDREARKFRRGFFRILSRSF